MDMITVCAEANTAEAVGTIREGLREFNYSNVGTYSYEHVVVTARDSEGTIVGGSFGGVYLNWLYVEVLWVREDYRKQGIGRRILNEMEAEGLRLGSTRCYLDTFGFQAEGLYVRQGYVEYGRIKDFVQGHDRIFLEKRLRP